MVLVARSDWDWHTSVSSSITRGPGLFPYNVRTNKCRHWKVCYLIAISEQSSLVMQIKESSRPISSSLTTLKLRLKKFLLEPITIALSIAWLGLVDNREDD